MSFTNSIWCIMIHESWFSDLYILFLILPLRIYSDSHRTYSDSKGDKQCFEAIMRLIHHNTFNKDFSARVHHYLDIMRSNGIQLSDLNSRTDQNILKMIDFLCDQNSDNIDKWVTVMTCFIISIMGLRWIRVLFFCLNDYS